MSAYNESPTTIVSGQTLGVVMVAFAVVTAAFHAFYTAQTAAYTSQIEQNTNMYRMIEYNITATLMMFVIAILCGIQSVTALVGVLFCTYVMLNLGIVLDSEKSTVLLTSAAWMAFVGAWLPCILAFSQQSSQAPDFVWAVLIVMIALYSTFGICQTIQHAPFDVKAGAK